MTSGLAKSILDTLTYSDHFGFPLTLREIHTRLITAHPYAEPSIFATLHDLLQKKKIGHTKDYYHLPGRSDLITTRASRAQDSHAPLLHARQLSHQLGRVPGVQAIYLTGSLAVKNASHDADIDFMIITQNNKLWTTRFFLTLYSSILGLRRTPNSTHNAGKVCLNLYLTPHSYTLPLPKRSLYTAYELIQAVPLYDPHHTHDALLAANSWIHEYLANVGLPPSSPPSSLENSGTGLLENTLFHLQLAYMSPKRTREYITSDAAFFHPHDPGKQVLAKLLVK